MSPLGGKADIGPNHAGSEIAAKQSLTNSRSRALESCVWYSQFADRHSFSSDMRQCMRRRDFIKLVGAAITAPPTLARAQPSGAMRRIAVIGALAPDDV